MNPNWPEGLEKTHKQCSKCGENKPIGAFYIRSRGGTTSSCKECGKMALYKWRRSSNKWLEYVRTYSQKNPEKIKTWKRATYINNKDKIKERNRSWQMLNREMLRVYAKTVSYPRHRVKILEQQKIRRSNNPQFYRSKYREYYIRNHSDILERNRNKHAISTPANQSTRLFFQLQKLTNQIESLK